MKKFIWRVELIFTLPEPVRYRKAKKLIEEYKHIASNCLPALNALLQLYKYLAERAERGKNRRSSIHYYEQMIELMCRHPQAKTDSTAIYLTLSSCYANLEKYEVALYFLKMFNQHAPHMVDYCNEMAKMIRHTQRNDYKKTCARSQPDSKVLLEAIRQPVSAGERHILLAIYAVVSKNVPLAFFYIEEALRMGYIDWDRIVQDSYLKMLIHTREFEALFLLYNKVRFNLEF